MKAKNNSSVALATLLYDSSYIDGVRVLGRSVLASSLKKNIWWSKFIVLVTQEVRREAKEKLRGEKWHFIDVATISAPYKVSAPRLKYAYSKLAIFNLTNYDRIVYIDADALALKNLSPLAKCPADFCAVMRQFELFNSGVLSIRPNRQIAERMRLAIENTFSYTGGDQGFLNSFFYNFESCPYFDPHHKFLLTHAKTKCQRLPSDYNGDWPLFFIHGSTSERRKKIIHLTFGAIKPWTWPIAPFLPTIAQWQSYALPRTNSTYFQTEFIVFLSSFFSPLLPALLFFFIIHRYLPPLSSPILRCALIFCLMIISARIALFCAPPIFSTITFVHLVWAKIVLWFTSIYLSAFFLYRHKCLSPWKITYSNSSFFFYAFTFVLLLFTALSGPTLLFFHRFTTLADLLCLLLPIIYAFLAINTAATLILIPTLPQDEDEIRAFRSFLGGTGQNLL
mmetsp:Transcript_17054/g.22099  ORF Transcript_17054/g.22099 Transcript_17054/m.22099 type:complete len:451 (+) Transcript_17054:39-1391(+)